MSVPRAQDAAVPGVGGRRRTARRHGRRRSAGPRSERRREQRNPAGQGDGTDDVDELAPDDDRARSGVIECAAESRDDAASADGGHGARYHDDGRGGRADDDIASPATVLVVVGNAGPADRLASRMVEILATYGYVNTMAATATQRRLSTEIYFAPGRDQEASHLAGTLGIPDEQVVPYPGTPITVGNEVGDLWLLVGNDWTQRFEGEASG